MQGYDLKQGVMLNNSKFWLVIGANLIYIAFAIYFSQDKPVPIFSVCPVLITSYIYGLRIGLFNVCFYSIIFHPLLFFIMLDKFFYSEGGELFGTMALFLIAFVVGRLHDLNRHLKESQEKVLRAQSEANEADLRVQTFVETAFDAIITMDQHFQIIEVNHAFEKAFGYSSEEVKHKPIHFLKSSNMNDKHQFHLNNYFKTSTQNVAETHTIEERVQKKNGEIFPVELYISKFSSSGETFYALVMRDISERKASELALKQSKVEAEEANQFKSQFLANMSHEIRTPMTSILGFLDILLKSPDTSKKQMEFLKIINSSSRSLLHLINDILDLSKLESGKVEYEPEVLDLRALMSDVMKLLNISAEDKGLAMELNLESSLERYIECDPLRLKQVLLNLAGNAIKFTRKGSVSIQVVAVQENQCLQFSVIDTGIGIPAEQIDTIFDQFIQVSHKSYNQAGGTGLGTTIAKELVELMGGQITVVSQMGTGTTFSFTIPYKPSQFLQAKPLSEPEYQTNRQFRILVADDIDENVQLLSLNLEESKHQVLTATNGIEAIETYKNKSLDLILMDVHMPMIDGIEATKIIRDMESNTESHIPIIALTASAMKTEKKRALEAGMDAIISKPIDFERLFKTIEELVPDKSRVKI